MRSDATASLRQVRLGTKSVYWDACIWLAWLRGEQRKPGDMEGVITSVNHVMSGACTLVVSRLIPDLEVRRSRMTAEQRALFEATLRRATVVLVDIEPPILELTKELVDFYHKEQRAGRVKAELSPWDAMHLATAINRKVEAFYTFDSGKRGGVDLLSLSGNVANHRLTIVKPPYIQAPLLFS